MKIGKPLREFDEPAEDKEIERWLQPQEQPEEPLEPVLLPA